MSHVFVENKIVILDSCSLVATAAANSQQQVNQLRQQLESEKSRAAVLDANLQAAAHSVRSSHAFKRRQRGSSRYAVQDSARMETNNDWQHALGMYGSANAACMLIQSFKHAFSELACVLIQSFKHAFSQLACVLM